MKEITFKNLSITLKFISEPNGRIEIIERLREMNTGDLEGILPYVKAWLVAKWEPEIYKNITLVIECIEFALKERRVLEAI